MVRVTFEFLPMNASVSSFRSDSAFTPVPPPTEMLVTTDFAVESAFDVAVPLIVSAFTLVSGPM